MSDYLTKVTAKALGFAPVVRPRLVSWFATPAPNPADTSGDFNEVVAGTDPSPENEHRVASVPRAGRKSRSEPSLDARTEPIYNVDTLREEVGSDQTARPPVRGAARIEVETHGSELPAGLLPVPASPNSALPEFTITPGRDEQVADSALGVSSPDGDSKPTAQNGATARLRSRDVRALDPHAMPSGEPLSAGRVSVAKSKTGAEENIERPSRENPGVDRSPQQIRSALLTRQSRFSPLRASATSEPETTIQVTIGRIEVRATPQQQPARGESQKRESTSELEQYLRRRTGGARE